MKQPFWTAWFVFSGCTEEPAVKVPSYDNTLEVSDTHVTLIVPDGMNSVPVEFQNYRQDRRSSALTLPTDTDSTTILRNVKRPFRILYPHQYIEFTAQDSFFFQDTQRTFLVRYLGSVMKPVTDPNLVSFDSIAKTADKIQYEGIAPTVDPVPSSSISLANLQRRANLGIAEGSSE